MSVLPTPYPTDDAVRRAALAALNVDALARLSALQWPELSVQMAVLAGEDHGSAMAPGLIDALAFAQQAR